MNKIIVAVAVYNRFENVKLWIRCWKQSNTEDAELVIIHNYYGNRDQLTKYESYCQANGIRYVPRDAPGFDIGAFQDVCRERLAQFPNDWDYLLWACDDTIPMTKDFIRPFINKLNHPGIGVACMEISPSVTTHIRTTGFALRKETANKIQFPTDFVTTKAHCYEFEHRGGHKIFYNQIIAMGLRAEMVDRKEKSPLWDKGYWKRLDRQAEHDSIFPSANPASDKVTFICPIYNMYPQIIVSLICQTHKNWELILIHNGPDDGKLPGIIQSFNDERIIYLKNPVNTGKWGHPLRQWALNEIAEDRISHNPGYIVITNADNYHAPVYCEYMVKGIKNNPKAAAVYCDAMVHSYKAWEVIPCRPARGYIDCAGVMVKKEIACEIGWRDVDNHSSDWVYFSDIIAKYGMRSFVPVKGCLLVHN